MHVHYFEFVLSEIFMNFKLYDHIRFFNMVV
jgi:hypothetical protein